MSSSSSSSPPAPEEGKTHGKMDPKAGLESFDLLQVNATTDCLAFSTDTGLAHLSAEELAAADQQRCEELMTFLATEGALFPTLTVKCSASGPRGVVALADVKKNTTLLHVPLRLILTSEVAQSSAICQLIKASGVQLRSWHSTFAAFLLQERFNPASYWLPYLRTLPPVFDSVPLNFTDDEKAFLLGSQCLQKATLRRQDLLKEYALLCEAVPAFSQFTAQHFIWARTVVITRVFGFQVKGKRMTGLVPFADMLNHAAVTAKQTIWDFQQDIQSFIIQATKAMTMGEAVFDSYGHKCNSRFLVNYGFALDDNDNDNEAKIMYSLQPSDPHQQVKLRFLGGRAEKVFSLSRDFRHNQSTLLCLSFFRVAQAQGNELLLLSSAHGLGPKLEPISLPNELRTLVALQKACTTALALFPTTIAEDDALLLLAVGKESKFTFNERNCIVVRRGEKAVLVHYITLATELLAVLDCTPKDVKLVLEPIVSDPWKKAYFTTVLFPLMQIHKHKACMLLGHFLD